MPETRFSTPTLRTLGLLGGLSWHSTAAYYEQINSTIEAELGEYRSAPLLLSSVDFGPIVAWQLAKEWDKAGDFLAQKAVDLQKAGAQALVICSNTMHKVADAITECTDVPLLHIAQGIAEELGSRGQHRAVLIGTRYTMRDSFLYEALRRHGIEAVPPPAEQAKAINKAIFKRLVFGQVVESDQCLLNTIVSTALENKYESVILGCTEIAMLVNDATPVDSVVDSTRAHTKLAVKFLIESGSRR